LAGVLGGLLGIGIAWLVKPKYKASLSFLLNENEGGMNLNLSSIAGLAGAYGMGGGGGQVNEDKLLFIASSRNIIGQTLLKKAMVYGKEDLLINHYIEEFNLRSGFGSDTALKNFERFIHTQLTDLTYAENKVLDKIYTSLQKGSLYTVDAKKKAGIVAQGAGIITLNFTTKNEELSKQFIDHLYLVLSNYYIQKSTLKQQPSVKVSAGAQLNLSRISDERLNSLAYHTRKMLLQLSKKPEYQDALNYMFGLLYGLERKIGEPVSFVSDANIKQSLLDLQALLENFAGGNKLDPFIRSMENFRKHLKDDHELRDYFRHLQDFIQRTLKDPTYIYDADYNRRLNAIVEKGQESLTDKYSDDTTNLVNSLSDFVEGIRNDELGQDLVKDLAHVGKSIFTDE
jgi:hypothetical protein